MQEGAGGTIGGVPARRVETAKAYVEAARLQAECVRALAAHLLPACEIEVDDMGEVELDSASAQRFPELEERGTDGLGTPASAWLFASHVEIGGLAPFETLERQAAFASALRELDRWPSPATPACDLGT